MSVQPHYKQVPASESGGKGTEDRMGPPNEDKLTPIENGGEVRIEGLNGAAKNQNGKEESKKKEKDEEPQKVVSMGELFRYADWKDKTLMVVGSLCALAHGSGLPLMMIVFGDMTDLFINAASGMNGLNLTALGITQADLADPVKMKEIAEQLNITLDNMLFDKMKEFSLYYFIIGIVVLFVAYGQVTFWLLASYRQSRKIRVHLFRSILRQEIGWFDTHEIGEINNRLSDDVNKIQEGTGDKIGNFLQWMASFFVGFVIGFIYGWKLTLVILAFTPILAAVGYVMTRLTTLFTASELKAYAKAGAVAEEVFGAIRTVVAFGGERKECKRYEVNLSDAQAVGVKKSVFSGLFMGIVMFLIFAVYALAFWYGSKLVREDPNYGAGRMLLVFFSVLIGAFSLGNAAPNLANLATARGAAFAIYEIIGSIPKIDSSSEEGTKPAAMKGNIEFRDVAFTYPSRPDTQVLKGLDLKINVGQSVALVGASGCGKSTTVQLLQRFYDPERGAVLIDGLNVRDLNVSWLRQHIGLVSQEPVLFGTTIAENIRYGRDGVTEEEIIKACKSANAHDFIKALPQRYETLVGERGAQLSGGQKQRIAIARALVSDPKILLLDEATSALDTESEAIVQSALDTARMGRTTLLIAHRLSTIKTADVIVGIDEGKVAEMGTHDELMAKEGIYYKLVTNQSSKTDEEDDDEGEVKSLTKQGSIRKGLASQMSVKGSVMKHEKEEEEKLPDPDMKRLYRMNAPEAGYIILGCLAAIVNGGVQPAFAIVFSEILGVYAKPLEEQSSDALFWSMMFLVIGLANGVAMFVQMAFFGISGERLTMRIRSLAFKSAVGQDIAYFDNHKNSVGALTTRLATDASAVQGVTGARLGNMLQALASVGTALVIGFIFSWQLTLAIIAFVPFIMVGGVLQMKLLQGDSDSNKGALETASKYSTESIENMRTVASLNRETAFYTSYERELAIPHKKSLRNAHLTGFAFSFTQALIFFAYAASFTLGAYQVEKGEITFDAMFKVFFALVMSAMGAGQASAFAPDYGKGKTAASHILMLFDRKPKIDAFSEEGDKIPGFKGSVSFSDVKFSYPTRPTVPVLTGLNLTAEPGQTVALVGSSGCGKSTTVMLTERFYDAASGNVLLDEKPLQSLNVSWVRSQMGIVSQEPVLFDCSIRENIEYGDNSREVPMDEVISAARAANIHSFIESLPDGYETNCGDKGAQLSGGQKQRVAIARALIRNPKILLLDEATSALDTESEKVVQEALDNARSGRTSIVIAHRLSTIRNADKIVVIRHGAVVEEGAHSELLARKGFYHRLHNAQLRQI